MPILKSSKQKSKTTKARARIGRPPKNAAARKATAGKRTMGMQAKRRATARNRGM